MKNKVDLNSRRTNNINLRKNNRSFYHNYNNNLSTEENNNPAETSNFQNQSTYELPKKANITIKMPLSAKISFVVLIIVSIVLFLMIYVVLFSDNNKNNGYLAITNQCPTVTVINTDCDNNGNCTNKYDGQVVFEDYIAGVVAGEFNGNNTNLEYYKVGAIVARTYFYNNFQSNCEVDGNSYFQKYIDINDSENKDLIIQAVEETKGQTLIQDEDFIEAYYSDACVINSDNNNYYIRYGSQTLEEPKIQSISKGWNSAILNKYYSTIDKNTGNDYTRNCPENNEDYGMSKIGAAYLTEKQNYTHKEVLKYYYGENIEIKNVNVASSEIINGFITPINNASCTSSFSCRKHPINNQYELHSGIDLGAAEGDAIYAAKAGRIIDVTKTVPGYSEEYSYGNNILIDHEDGTRTRYAHLLYGSIPNNIEVGEIVEQGQIIGQVGSTGISTGNHLHYEIYLNGELQNPIDYLDLSIINNSELCNENTDIPLSSCGL